MPVTGDEGLGGAVQACDLDGVLLARNTNEKKAIVQADGSERRAGHDGLAAEMVRPLSSDRVHGMVSFEGLMAGICWKPRAFQLTVTGS